MKTLRVSLADIEGRPHGSHHANTNVAVTARYTGPVTLADGRIVPAVIKAKQLSTGATGYVDFEVYASDDSLVHADWRGFAIVVTATITHARSGKQLGQVARTVKVLSSHTSPVALGSIEPAEGLPRGWVTVAEMEALLTELEETVTQAAADAADAAARAGVYYDGDGGAIPFVFVASDTDPGQTKTVNGVVHEVWWAQTSPPDPSQWVPKPVTQDVTARSYTVPTDSGATYTVGGVLRSPGTYAVGTSAVTLAWVATPKSGYAFKSGATTSGSLVFDAKTYGPGDVLFSDSFAREGILAGSTSDSFEGGEALVWQNAHTSGSTIRTQNGIAVGVRTTSDVGSFSFDEITFPVALDRFDLYLVAQVVDPARPTNNETTVWLFNNSTQVARTGFGGDVTMYQPSAAALGSAPSTTPGDLLRFEYRSGQVIKCYNVTKGTASSYTGSFVPTATPINKVRFDFRPGNNTPIGTTPRLGADSIKVVVQ